MSAMSPAIDLGNRCRHDKCEGEAELAPSQPIIRSKELDQTRWRGRTYQWTNPLFHLQTVV